MVIPGGPFLRCWCSYNENKIFLSEILQSFDVIVSVCSVAGHISNLGDDRVSVAFKRSPQIFHGWFDLILIVRGNIIMGHMYYVKVYMGNINRY